MKPIHTHLHRPRPKAETTRRRIDDDRVSGPRDSLLVNGVVDGEILEDAVIVRVQLVVGLEGFRRVGVHAAAPPRHVPVAGGRVVGVDGVRLGVHLEGLAPASRHLGDGALHKAGDQRTLGHVEVGVGSLEERQAGHTGLYLQLEHELVEAGLQGEAGDINQGGLV